ncbi:MAG: Kelch repeat-containing protein [Planctomycetota bacterium]
MNRRATLAVSLTRWLVVALLVVGCAKPRQSNIETRSAELARSLSTVAPLEAARHGHSAQIVDHQLIVLGGFADGSLEADRGGRETWRQDLTTRTWRRGADMPTERAFFATVVIQNTLYAIGSGIDSYDIGLDAWRNIVATDSTPRSHFGAPALGTKIYVLGGFPAAFGGFFAIDIETRGIDDLPEPPNFKIGDHFHIVSALNGAIHVIGGILHEKFDVSTQHWVLDGSTWRAAAPPPTSVWTKFAVVQVADDDLYYFCGPCGLRFDATTDRWSDAAPLEPVICMPASVYCDDKILVLGGLYVDSGPSRVVHQYDIDNDEWLRLVKRS